MERGLNNIVIVVTGGAQGIGYNIIDQYLSVGVQNVILLDFNKTKGEEAIADLTAKHGNGKVIFIHCDVTKDLEKVSKKILDEYKYVDLLVNNAGAADETSARKTLELNSIAVMEWTMKFWEQMRKDKGGRGGTIINIGSIYSYAVDPYVTFYKASKFAVMGFTRSLGHAKNFYKFGVRVMILCPGFTYTAATAKKPQCWPEHVEDLTQSLKTQVWQNAEDVGKAAVEMFKTAKSGSAWKVIGGVMEEVVLVGEGDEWR